MIEIGNFKDLETLVALLNRAWADYEYRLEPVEGQKNMFLFIEDPLNEEEYECGIVEKKGSKAYAVSDSVHEMIIGAYLRFKEENSKIG